MPITSLQDVRDEGIDATMATDSQVNAAIATWEAAFVEACRQWFEPVSATITFDGDGSNSALFSIPIISVVEIQDLERSEVIDANNYVVYNGRTLLKDDRRNPKILLKDDRRFELGKGRYQIEGTWGFTESDDSCPPQVRYAMLKLVIEKLLTPMIPALSPTLPDLPTQVGQKVEEETDEHRIAWANPNNAKFRKDVNEGLTKDPFILETIRRYSVPMGIGAPVTWNFHAIRRNVHGEVF